MCAFAPSGGTICRMNSAPVYQHQRAQCDREAVNMNDDNTEAPELPVLTESKPIPVDFAFPFGERLRSGLLVNLILAEARRRTFDSLSRAPDWNGEWRSAARHEWHLYLDHARFNTKVVVSYEGKSPRVTVLTMLTPAPEPFDAALTRAVNGIESAVPELVNPCIETFGLIPIEGGYARTKGKPDDPDNFLYPMRDFIRGYAEKYELLQQMAIGDLVAEFARTFAAWAKANLVAKALDLAATNASMTTTQGYRVVLHAPCSSLMCCNQIVRITQQSGFVASPPEWLSSTCERMHIRWQHDSSGYSRLVSTIFVFQISAHSARIEVDVLGVDALTPLFVRTIEEIRETLGIVDFRAEIVNEEVQLESPPVADFGEALGTERAISPESAESSADAAKSGRKRRRTKSIDPQVVVARFKADRAAGRVDSMEAWSRREGIAYKSLNRYMKEVEGETGLQD